MANLDEHLHARGIINFGEYATDLSPVTLSGFIRNGAGADSMTAANRAWSNLIRPFYSWAAAHKEISAKIRRIWTGSSAQQMEEILSEYSNWQYEIASQACQTFMLHARLIAAYASMCENIVMQEFFLENREELEELRQLNISGAHSVRIAELEREFDEWQSNNVDQIINYYNKAKEITAELPLFPESPGVIYEEEFEEESEEEDIEENIWENFRAALRAYPVDFDFNDLNDAPDPAPAA